MAAFTESIRIFPAALDVPASGNGAPLLVERLSNITIQVAGTFTGTFALDTTIDGETWVEDTASISAGYITVAEDVRFVRLRRTGAGTDPAVTVDGEGQGEP